MTIFTGRVLRDVRWEAGTAVSTLAAERSACGMYEQLPRARLSDTSGAHAGWRLISRFGITNDAAQVGQTLAPLHQKLAPSPFGTSKDPPGCAVGPSEGGARAGRARREARCALTSAVSRSSCRPGRSRRGGGPVRTRSCASWSWSHSVRSNVHQTPPAPRGRHSPAGPACPAITRCGDPNRGAGRGETLDPAPTLITGLLGGFADVVGRWHAPRS